MIAVFLILRGVDFGKIQNTIIYQGGFKFQDTYRFFFYQIKDLNLRDKRMFFQNSNDPVKHFLGLRISASTPDKPFRIPPKE